MHEQPSWSFGPFRLDERNEQLWREHEALRLTNKAFAVLRFLVEHSGQLVTKEELFAAVWPRVVVGDSALVVCIRELRQALGDERRTPQFIETVHGRGYRFVGKIVRNEKLGVRSEEEEANQESKGKSQKAKVEEVEAGTKKAEPVDAGLLSQPLTPNPQPLLLPDKPSIVVLPFANLSGDHNQEYFSDGITEEITATLSRVSGLFVVARTSAFAYKGKGVKVQEISRELGVRYVLEGSVQRADGQIRIIAQLIDATTGGHLWAEHYHRPLKDIFVVQDEIVQQLAMKLRSKMYKAEKERVLRIPTSNLTAYESVLRGMANVKHELSKEANIQAQRMFENAIALDPQYAEAYIGLSATYFQQWIWRLNTNPQTLERAMALAQHAIALDDSLPLAHSLLGSVYAKQQQYDQAVIESERALALDPNNADYYFGQAHTFIWVGKAEEAISLITQAMRLNPHYPSGYLFQLGWASRLTGRYAEAIAVMKEFLGQSPGLVPGHLQLAFGYAYQWAYQQSTGAETLEQALAAAQRVLTINSSDPLGHALWGLVSLWQKQYEQAIAEGERAVILNSNLADGYAFLAEALSRVGRSEDALRMAEQALRHNSWVRDEHLRSVGVAYDLAGRPEEAVAPLQQFLSRYPSVLGAHLTLAAVYSELGKDAEAQAEVTEVLRLNPKFSLEVHKERVPIRDLALLERHLAALWKAGLK